MIFHQTYLGGSDEVQLPLNPFILKKEGYG